MSLIKSISGIRGTIGGRSGDGLTPIDVVKFTAAFGTWTKEKTGINKIVIGRDARPSGEMISRLVIATLQGIGVDVVDLDLSTTPTVEIAVTLEKAGGGIIITASHNPVQWNALKLVNQYGEFISDKDGAEVLKIAKKESFVFAEVKKLGHYKLKEDYIEKHVDLIVKLPLVDVNAIKARNFRIAIDCVNSTGGIAVPMLLKALGVVHVTKFYCDPNGFFPHNPEPLPENITHICNEIKHGNFDLGIVVDPDVDRLAIVNEDGTPFGEEFTLVAVADYVLSQTPGNTVSNLSSTQALKEITEKRDGVYTASAVGEVNVVTKMKETGAVIGGEGNGGIIYPELHYGRDALVGIALFLTHLAKFGKLTSMLRASYPKYHISKNKIELTNGIDVDTILEQIQEKYSKEQINTIDGVKIEFSTEWVHLRKSNTEPIIRIYSESDSIATADYLANKIISDIKEIITSNN
ncbi:MAG: phosphoglucosamine mutase [Bacteroidota bacterium]|nr:phosphoglucosamine mutase [Bacteroidota bacterium]